MVLPERIIRAATRASFVLGDGDQVAAWLESGRCVNDVDDLERTMLIHATYGPSPEDDGGGKFDEEHVALARYLLDHGADVNRHDYNGDTPLHYAALGRSESSPAMVALLLKAGANVLATNSNRDYPLKEVLCELANEGPSRSRMEVALLLLRALPSLDHARVGAVTGTVYSAEGLLDGLRSWAEGQADLPLHTTNCLMALRAVVVGVRAAGGWRTYDRRPRAEVLRLRSLALRRRAVLPRATRHNGPDIRSLDFLVRCPPEIAWHILGYWRCQYPVETDMIDQLGYR